MSPLKVLKGAQRRGRDTQRHVFEAREKDRKLQEDAVPLQQAEKTRVVAENGAQKTVASDSDQTWDMAAWIQELRAGGFEVPSEWEDQITDESTVSNEGM